jgi:hypothetical protein
MMLVLSVPIPPKRVALCAFFGLPACYWPILLQKSKIERPQKSRESRFLDAPAAARLSEANTKVGGRFGMKRYGPLISRRAKRISGL